MSLREWLESTKAAQAARRPASASDPAPAPPPVRPIPPIGSPEYGRASLGRKFWIATSVTLPERMAAQRALQAMTRTPGFDPWAAAELLREIETFVRERGTASTTP